jgi:hypothetical protein
VLLRRGWTNVAMRTLTHLGGAAVTVSVTGVLLAGAGRPSVASTGRVEPAIF